jgi:2-methylcitrate dehydratase
VKRYPVEYHAQAAVGCALALRGEHDVAPDDIERIENETYEAAVSIIADGAEKWRPETRETVDHSMPYCIARAFLDGEMTLAQFEEGRYTDPAVRDLMDRVEVTETPVYTDWYGESFPHRMVVHTTVGSHEREVEYPKGHSENPLTDAELTSKFETATAGRLDDEQRAAILDAARDLPDLERVSTLTGRL